MQASDRPLSVNEAVAFTGNRKSYLYKLMHLGKIAYFRPTEGKAVFLEADLRAFMLRGRRSADFELADKADAILAGR